MSDIDTYRPGGEDCEEVQDFYWTSILAPHASLGVKAKLWDGEAW